MTIHPEDIIFDHPEHDGFGVSEHFCGPDCNKILYLDDWSSMPLPSRLNMSDIHQAPLNFLRPEFQDRRRCLAPCSLKLVRQLADGLVIRAMLHRDLFRDDWPARYNVILDASIRTGGVYWVQRRGVSSIGWSRHTLAAAISGVCVVLEKNSTTANVCMVCIEPCRSYAPC